MVVARLFSRSGTIILGKDAGAGAMDANGTSLEG